ncbi:hypothetical protein AB1P65_13435 [Roseibium alexandrii]
MSAREARLKAREVAAWIVKNNINFENTKKSQDYSADFQKLTSFRLKDISEYRRQESDGSKNSHKSEPFPNRMGVHTAFLCLALLEDRGLIQVHIEDSGTVEYFKPVIEDNTRRWKRLSRTPSAITYIRNFLSYGTEKAWLMIYTVGTIIFAAFIKSILFD